LIQSSLLLLQRSVAAFSSSFFPPPLELALRASKQVHTVKSEPEAVHRELCRSLLLLVLGRLHQTPETLLPRARTEIVVPEPIVEALRCCCCCCRWFCWYCWCGNRRRAWARSRRGRLGQVDVDDEGMASSGGVEEKGWPSSRVGVPSRREGRGSVVIEVR
jgi:hypothetical protein